MNFCGSYQPDDVTFLLKPLATTAFVDVEQKEFLIQSGQCHYSELLSLEKLPPVNYLELFDAACAANAQQMARDCLKLAAIIADRRSETIVLISLARGGTPIGVILKHLLTQIFQRSVVHYSVSIIRDRGLDLAALRHVLAVGHSPESLVFVDGWTGKGIMARELSASIHLFNQHNKTAIDSGLYVLVDLAGAAEYAASSEDYLIPSSLLNATVSGLISRSVLNPNAGPDEFHSCYCYPQFAAQDRSRVFVQSILDVALTEWRHFGIPKPTPLDKVVLAETARQYQQQLMSAYALKDNNMIKPGIGEATRVLLRRSPGLLLLRDSSLPATAHLRLLAEQKQVPLVVDAQLPYQAVSLIRSAFDG